MMMLSNCKEGLIVLLLFYCARIILFFIFINLLKLNLQHLQRFKFDKMIVNATILPMIYILSMYIAIQVFTVVKKNCLGWNVNVLRLPLKHSIFNVIICSIIFIAYKLLVDGAIIILDDSLLKNTFLNDLSFCFMIFAVFSNDTTEIIMQTTARTTKIHITSLWAGYNINTFTTSCVVDANLSNNPATAMSIVGTEEKQKEKAKRQARGNNNRREAILNIKNNNNTNVNQCCTTLMCFVFFWLNFFLFFLFFIRCCVLMFFFYFFFPLFFF